MAKRPSTPFSRVGMSVIGTCKNIPKNFELELYPLASSRGSRPPRGIAAIAQQLPVTCEDR